MRENMREKVMRENTLVGEVWEIMDAMIALLDQVEPGYAALTSRAFRQSCMVTSDMVTISEVSQIEVASQMAFEAKGRVDRQLKQLKAELAAAKCAVLYVRNDLDRFLHGAAEEVRASQPWDEEAVRGLKRYVNKHGKAS